MITKQAANQAYEMGVEMALQDAGLLKTALVREMPGMFSEAARLLSPTAKAQAEALANQSLKGRVYTHGLTGGAGLGALLGGTAGGFAADEDNTLAGILGGAGLGAGIGLGGGALARRAIGSPGKRVAKDALGRIDGTYKQILQEQGASDVARMAKRQQNIEFQRMLKKTQQENAAPNLYGVE